MLGGFFLWKKYYRLGEEHLPADKNRTILARTTMYGMMGVLVLGPISLINSAFSDGQGALAKLVPQVEQFQNSLGKRFDRLEVAISILTEKTEDQEKTMRGVRESSERQEKTLIDVKESSERQEEKLDDVKDVMELSQALAIVEMACERRDGSNLMQSKALETLVANSNSFSGADFSGVSIRNAKLDNIDFSDGRFHFTSFENSQLRGANFSNSDLRFSDAKGADFSGANMNNGYAPFFEAPGTRFAGASLRGCNFYGANLRGADLSNADLTGAAFALADLRDADLRGADLTRTHFVGALLTGAKLKGAKFKSTNMLAAALDPDLLTGTQRAGTCRHRPQEGKRVRVDIAMRWPSNKFSSGYQYDDLLDYFSYAYKIMPSGLNDTSLPLCTTSGRSARGFNAAFPCGIGMNLDRVYLSKKRRREEVMNRVKNLSFRMNDERKGAKLFTGTGEEQRLWYNELYKTSNKAEPIAGPYLNSEQIILLLLASNFLDVRSLDWFLLAENRLKLERNIRRQYDGLFNRHTRWGPFFPENDERLSELSREKFSDLYKNWTKTRLKNIGNGLIVKPSYKVVNKNRDRNSQKVISFDSKKNGFRFLKSEYLRGSHKSGLTEAEAAVVGKLECAELAPVYVPGINRVFLVFPEIYKNYYLEFPKDISHRTFDIEVDLRIEKIKRLQDTVFIFVTPKQARIYENEKLVYKGMLSVNKDISS